MFEYDEKNPIRIVIADDHEVVRTGIRRMLSVDKSLQILEEASNGKDAVEMVKYHVPDIVLLDIQMPEMNGIDATKVIKSQMGGIYIVMLTAFEDNFHLEKAIVAGADGYLSKDISAKELIQAIKTVIEGERVFSKSIVKVLQRKYIPESEYESTPIIITKREQQILNLVATGKTSGEIGEILNISNRTVESHRYNLMNKLGVKNTAGLVRYAVVNSTDSASEM